MDKKTFQTPRSIERRYRRAIGRLLSAAQGAIAKAATAEEAIAIIRRFARAPTFRSAAYDIVRSMMTQLAAQNQRSWRAAAYKGSRGRAIYNALKRELSNTQLYHQIIQANADYITSVPEDVAERLTTKMARGYEAGRRPADLLREVLEEWPDMTAAKARTIARTEVSKASTALTHDRCERAGIDWYVWRNSEDERVRSSHRAVDGVIIAWNEPCSPEELDPRHEQRPYGKYHAGETFNCRCYPQPLLEFSDVSWPHKVYYHGRLRSMTLAEFKRINGGTL